MGQETSERRKKPFQLARGIGKPPRRSDNADLTNHSTSRSGKAKSSGPARRATRTIGCERGWLRPDFISVCLDETEDRASTAPESGKRRLRWLPSWCLVSLLGSRRQDRVPTRRGKRWRLRFTEEMETWHKKVAGFSWCTLISTPSTCRNSTSGITRNIYRNCCRCPAFFQRPATRRSRVARSTWHAMNWKAWR